MPNHPAHIGRPSGELLAGKRRAAGIAAAAVKPVQQEELLDTIRRGAPHRHRRTARKPGHRPNESDGARTRSRLLPLPSRCLRARPLPSSARWKTTTSTSRSFSTSSCRLTGTPSRSRRTDGKPWPLWNTTPSGCAAPGPSHAGAADGFHVVEAVLQCREHDTDLRLPIVALTARSMKGDRERCLQAGMDEYVAKPVRRAELFAAIERVLADRPPGAAPFPSPASEGEASPAAGPLDAPLLLTACDGDGSLLDQMIAVFRASALDHLSIAANALARRDAKGVLRIGPTSCAGWYRRFPPLPLKAPSDWNRQPRRNSSTRPPGDYTPLWRT